MLFAIGTPDNTFRLDTIQGSFYIKRIVCNDKTKPNVAELTITIP